MDRLLCDVDDRLGSNGVQELKVHQQIQSTHVCSLHVCCCVCKYDTNTATDTGVSIIGLVVMSKLALALACLSLVSFMGRQARHGLLMLHCQGFDHAGDPATGDTYDVALAHRH